MVPVISCTHGVSLEEDCKMCEQENKVYDKERIALGYPVKERVQ